MSPEARVQRKTPPEPTWSWSGFPKKANRLISGFIEDLETPDSETSPEYCSIRASALIQQINSISFALNIEYKGGRPQIPYNPLADAFLTSAVVLLYSGQEDEIVGHLIELSDELRSLAKDPKGPQVSLIHPKITPNQMLSLLSNPRSSQPRSLKV